MKYSQKGLQKYQRLSIKHSSYIGTYLPIYLDVKLFPWFLKLFKKVGSSIDFSPKGRWVVDSVIRLDDILHFGQLFKTFGNNYFAQTATFLGNFCEVVKIFHFSSGIIFGQLLSTFGDFLLVTLVGESNWRKIMEDWRRQNPFKRHFLSHFKFAGKSIFAHAILFSFRSYVISTLTLKLVMPGDSFSREHSLFVKVSLYGWSPD